MAERVLIVEDEDKIARVLQDYLVQSGFTTHHLSRGDEVEPWMREHGADLVVVWEAQAQRERGAGVQRDDQAQPAVFAQRRRQGGGAVDVAKLER